MNLVRSLIKKLKGKAQKPYFVNTLSEPMAVAQDTSYIRWDNSTATNASVPMASGGFISSSEPKSDERIEKKPVEIVAEVVAEVPEIDLVDLDGKIKLVEKRLKCFKRLSCAGSDEQIALRYLKSRKLLKKHFNKFNWKITTNAKVNELVKKYKVQLVHLSGYYKSLPMEAVNELERFMDAWDLVAGDYQPELKLIIDSGGKEQKKDPILLATSPFGSWWYILGAWDKEVLYVDDIVYNGK